MMARTCGDRTGSQGAVDLGFECPRASPAAQIDERSQIPAPPKAARPSGMTDAERAATAQMIKRSAARARGEITELPVDPVAREILKAGAKARNEPFPGGEA